MPSRDHCRLARRLARTFIVRPPHASPDIWPPFPTYDTPVHHFQELGDIGPASTQCCASRPTVGDLPRCPYTLSDVENVTSPPPWSSRMKVSFSIDFRPSSHRTYGEPVVNIILETVSCTLHLGPYWNKTNSRVRNLSSNSMKESMHARVRSRLAAISQGPASR